jgi:hypothetical protein
MALDDGLTAHERKLLNCLQADGGWMSRRDLARAMSQAQVQHHSTQALNHMADRGLIEMRRVRGSNNISRYEYRVKPANGV